MTSEQILTASEPQAVQENFSPARSTRKSVNTKIRLSTDSQREPTCSGEKSPEAGIPESNLTDCEVETSVTESKSLGSDDTVLTTLKENPSKTDKAQAAIPVMKEIPQRVRSKRLSGL